MTNPLPPDPNALNNERAQWADDALRCFQQATGTDDEALIDLICDLMHWCDRNNADFDAALSTARVHYDAETAPVPPDHPTTPKADMRVSPIDAARALTPRWMRNIRDFDALEIHPCLVIGNDSLNNQIVEQCETTEAHFWTVYVHLRTGGVDAFEDFSTEAEADAFHDQLIAVYPHLAKEG
jgi:hypothetical protein